MIKDCKVARPYRPPRRENRNAGFSHRLTRTVTDLTKQLEIGDCSGRQKTCEIDRRSRACAPPAIANRKSAIENQLTHLPPVETRIGNSSSMNWVLPSAPHIRIPVAACQCLLISSPVWQPQLFTNASLAKARRSIFARSFSCNHAFDELSTTLL